MKVLPVAILAGGLGTRIQSVSRGLPKSLMVFNGKPFLEWQLQLLEKNKCKAVVICVGHKSDLIKNYLEDRPKSKLDIKLSYDGNYNLGTGGALVKARKYLGKAFLVLYGDSYLSVNFEEVSENFLSVRKSGLLTVLKNDLNFEPSNVYFRNNLVLQYDKINRSNKMKYIDYGLSAFKSDAFTEFSSTKFLDLSIILSQLAMQRQLAGYEVYERYYEVGSIQGTQDFQELSKELL
jgi:NDP-sugar pyrophosphorylase family protein